MASPKSYYFWYFCFSPRTSDFQFLWEIYFFAVRMRRKSHSLATVGFWRSNNHRRDGLSQENSIYLQATPQRFQQAQIYSLCAKKKCICVNYNEKFQTGGAGGKDSKDCQKNAQNGSVWTRWGGTLLLKFTLKIVQHLEANFITGHLKRKQLVKTGKKSDLAAHLLGSQG